MKRSFTSQVLHERTSGKSRLTETARHEDDHDASSHGLRGPDVKGLSNITPYFLLDPSPSGSHVANDPPNHGVKAKATPVDGRNVVKANRLLLESFGAKVGLVASSPSSSLLRIRTMVVSLSENDQGEKRLAASSTTTCSLYLKQANSAEHMVKRKARPKSAVNPQNGRKHENDKNNICCDVGRKCANQQISTTRKVHIKPNHNLGKETIGRYK